MRRWLKNTALSVIATVISLGAITGPVFATATNPNTTTTPNTSTTTPSTTTTPDTTTNPTTTTPGTTTTPSTGTTAPNTSTTTPNTTTSPNNTSTNAEESTEEEVEDINEAEQEEAPTCYDQVGGLGWLICPGVGVLANIIDGAYNILDILLRVDPIPDDPNSPIHVVWDYARGITNLIFVIFFLVIIFSHLTGIGINNYGIKRMLPRLVVAAILINLSYTICTLAVDLSNILGIALRNVFLNIQTAAIANGTINEYVSGVSTAGIVATILGVGTIGTATALTFGGSVFGLIWLLIPIILSGAIAIISAIITMAARQALIFLLVMIAPLAFVCYLLPNTEKWFNSWYKLFSRMIFFYPIFSVLYGASQLAGFITISSATNWIGVILGIAIQVLPLFFSIPLLRMSGTILGGIDGFIRRTTDPAANALRRRAAEGQALSRARQLSSTNNLPTNRLARWLEQRRVDREFDLNTMLADNKDTYLTRSMTSMIRGNDRKSVDARGSRYYEMISRKIANENARARFDTDMDEGFDNGSAVGPLGLHHLNHLSNNRIARANATFGEQVIEGEIVKARQQSVARENMHKRATRIRDELSDESQRASSEIHKQITEAFRLDNNPAADTEEALAVQRSVSQVLANAISQKRRVDSDLKSNYLELYDDAPAGSYIRKQLIDSFKNNDYNSASAAILTMAKRGDHDQIIRELVEHSGEISNNYAMQKVMADTCSSLKSENLYVWAWAKANMMRKSMSEENGNDPSKNIASYIDFETFLGGGRMAGDGDDPRVLDRIQKTSLQQIFNDLSSWAPVATQDRTVFKEVFKLTKEGVIPMGTDRNGNAVFPLLIPDKHFRSAGVSGMMDGEQLAMHDRILVGGFDLAAQKAGQRQDQWFYDNQAAIENQIRIYLRDMSTGQLATSKSNTILNINGALLEMHPEQAQQGTLNGAPIQVSTILLDALQGKITAIQKPNYSGQRNSMNVGLCEMLGIPLDN